VTKQSRFLAVMLQLTLLTTSIEWCVVMCAYVSQQLLLDINGKVLCYAYALQVMTDKQQTTMIKTNVHSHSIYTIIDTSVYKQKVRKCHSAALKQMSTQCYRHRF